MITKIIDAISLKTDNKPTEMRALVLAVLGTALVSTIVMAVTDINPAFMVMLSGALFLAIILTLLGFTAIGSWSALIASLGNLHG
ncbi:MAG: hypothetical protein OHK003_15140 [Anaerolineales bacterium]